MPQGIAVGRSLAGKRVIDLHRHRVIDQALREVSLTFQRSRNAGQRRVVTGVVPGALVIEEEECLVVTVVEFRNHYRTSKGSAEDVVVEYADGHAVSIGVPVVGVQHVVAEVFVAGTVELVGARARNQHYGASRQTAVFRRKTVGHDVEFADGFHRGDRSGYVVLVAGGNWNAVDEVLGLSAAASVDSEIGVVSLLRRSAIDVGGERGEGERVPVVRRQLLNAPVVDDHAGLRIIGAQQRGLGGDLYVFGSSADLHVQIDGDPVANAENQADAFQVLETPGIGLSTCKARE